MANINDKRDLCHVMEYTELRELIDSNPSLEEIKIVSMGDFTLGADSKKLVNKAKRIQLDDTEYSSSDADRVKISAILKMFNLDLPMNSYLIATKGKGEINTALQNDAAAFTQAEINAEGAMDGYEGKCAVFIDTDARSTLREFFKNQNAAANTSSFVIAESEEEALLNATQKIEEAIEDNPALRFAILTGTIDEIIQTCESISGTQNRAQLEKLQRLLNVIKFGTTKAKFDYDELSKNFEDNEKALKARIETLTKNKDELLVESEALEASHKTKMTEKDTKIQELREQLTQSETDEDTAKLKLQLQNVTDVKNDLEKDHTKHQQKIAHLEFQLSSLNKTLTQVERSKTNLENAYNEQTAKLTDLKNKLETNGLAPNDINKTLRELPDSKTQSNVLPDIKSMNESDIIKENAHFPPSLPAPQFPTEASPENKSFGSPGSESSPKSEKGSKSNRNVICKLTNFGLNTWNPQTTDLHVHLETALKAGEEALQVGAATTSVRRMILNSLGEKYRYVESFLKDVSKPENSIDDFTCEIAKILGKKPSTQMQDFLSAQRKSGEDLLAYFARLCRLYKASANFIDDKWENDPSHTMSIYSKIYESCYSEQKSEFIRKTEDSLGKRTLTLPDLRTVLIDVNQVSTTKMNAEEPEINNLNHKSGYRFKGKGKPRTFGKKPWYEDKEKEQSNSAQKKYEKKMDCWYCGKTGHYKANCYRFLRSKGEKIASPRETKTNRTRE